mmetsp:Transcript_34472/g.98952  ORF Transcript_34472/g.98952 Transcript_34472/m.98952 type:complete len:159 (+) Transcript_34472:524-1000(+)
MPTDLAARLEALEGVAVAGDQRQQTADEAAWLEELEFMEYQVLQELERQLHDARQESCAFSEENARLRQAHIEKTNAETELRGELAEERNAVRRLELEVQRLWRANECGRDVGRPEVEVEPNGDLSSLTLSVTLGHSGEAPWHYQVQCTEIDGFSALA